ncbi:glycosyltransferase [Desulfocurvus sp.]|uniref:glycosyltransferase n=1 Tax=Desulfocurvus sp. TaxID=2871698 RepID=UPI0025C4DC50|nr:glycosyltransferase [Desulfocurvus sp.]MCK9241076.1 glycosyltransferase [Desulfocurvus sp.]
MSAPRRPRNLLFLNAMPLDVLVTQGRQWEALVRSMPGYSGRVVSVYHAPGSTGRLDLAAGNICLGLPTPCGRVPGRPLRGACRTVAMIPLVARLYALCREHAIDAVVSQSNALRDLELAALAAARLRGIPFVGYTGRNHDDLRRSKTLMGRAVDRLERFILRAADIVILRPGTVDVFADFFGLDRGRVHVVPHLCRFADMAGKAAVPPEVAAWAGDDPVIFYYGRMDARKYPQSLVAALPLVLRREPRARLLLVGPGEFAGELLRGLDPALAGRILLLGAMDQPRLAALSRFCPVHAHLTGGKGLLESALMDRPAVAWDDKAYTYGLLDGSPLPLRARFGDVADLADRLAALLADPEAARRCGLGMGRAARELVDEARVAAALQEAVERALRLRRRDPGRG